MRETLLMKLPELLDSFCLSPTMLLATHAMLQAEQPELSRASCAIVSSGDSVAQSVDNGEFQIFVAVQCRVAMSERPPCCSSLCTCQAASDGTGAAGAAQAQASGPLIGHRHLQQHAQSSSKPHMATSTSGHLLHMHIDQCMFG